MPQKAKEREFRLSVCLVYPNTQKVGASYLGFHKIYSALSEVCDCDTAFLPEGGGKLRSQNQNRELGSFDLLAFSLTFETDILNVLEILKRAGVPLEREERDDDQPLVCAGGIAPTLNPEPFADFFDFMVIGEGELTLREWVEKLAESGGKRRMERLESLAGTAGVYVPSLYEEELAETGRIISRKTLGSGPAVVKRLYDVSFAKKGSAQVMDMETVFGDSWLLETGKGCGQGCRFCAAGFIYRPTRHVDLERLVEQISDGLARKKRIGLIGSAICEHPDIKKVYAEILRQGGGINVSSLRIGYVDSEMLRQLVRGGLHTMTIAPEAGTERLRRSVNKNVADAEILGTVGEAVTAGMRNVKMYFLVGLPGEEDGDVTAIVTLVKKLRDEFVKKSKPLGRAGKITVAVNPFVPKPQTPFQWEPFAAQKDLKRKMAEVKKGLSREANVELKLESGKGAAVQALMSLGNRTAGRGAVRAFTDGDWKNALREAGLASASLAGRDKNEILPWDFIDSGVTKEYLWKERERAFAGKVTPPCPPGLSGCERCGKFLGNCC